MNREKIAEELLKIAEDFVGEVEEIEEIEPQGSRPTRERKKSATTSMTRLLDSVSGDVVKVRTEDMPDGTVELSIEGRLAGITMFLAKSEISKLRKFLA